MSRWTRPVRAAALFASPELALRTAGEQQLSSYGADEGEGTGFDGLDASAMASRVWVAAGDPRGVLREYRDALVDLGWRQAYPTARTGSSSPATRTSACTCSSCGRSRPPGAPPSCGSS